MSSKQDGGRKISGEEKNLANAQAQLFGYQTDQLKQLQAALQGLQPQSYAIMGLNPNTGMPLRPGEMPPMPTAPAGVGDPGPRPVEYRSVFSGKNWGKNDQAKQDQSIAAIRDWDQKNAQYQQYLQQKQSYDAQVAQIQQLQAQGGSAANSYYLPDPTQQRGQLEDYFNQIMAGQLNPASAYASGRLGTEAATQAGFAGQLRDIFSGTQTQDQAINSLLDTYMRQLSGDIPEAGQLQTLLGNYQNQLNGNIPEAGQMQELLSNYRNQLSGDIPEAGQLQGFLNQITTGQQGNFAINPAVQRALDEAEQQRRTRMFQQLGSGWETSTAGFEAMSDVARNKAGTIDALNQQDMAQALQGYLGLLGGAESRKAQTANQYLGLLSGTEERKAQTANQYLGLLSGTENRKAQTANQYLGLSGDKIARTGSALQGYLGSSQAAQQRIMQEYQDEWNKRTGQLGAYAQIATAPYTGVDFTNLINSYTGALGAATQRQTGPVQQGAGAGIGGLAGTLVGGGIGAAFGGPAGMLFGAGLGGQAGGMAGGGIGYQAPSLWNNPQWSWGGGQSNPFSYGAFQTNPYFLGG